MRIFLACLGLVMLPLVPAAQAQQASDHYHWRPVSQEQKPRPWAILLPGASGLKIFDDEGHYFRMAEWLNARGIDALVVDYRSATKLLPDTQKGKPGPRIAKIVDYAVADARAQNRLDLRCSGIVIGWSLGGEGMWEIAAGGFDKIRGLTGAVGFYPSVFGQKKGYAPKTSILILQGEEDGVTKVKHLDKFVSGAVNPARVSVHKFAGAQHGFDVASLAVPNKAGGRTMAYDSQADVAAKALLARQLDQWGIGVGKGCALD